MCFRGRLHFRELDHCPKNTERLGCRAFDVLHVALALELECETFLTSDRIQRALARAEGLDPIISPEE